MTSVIAPPPPPPAAGQAPVGHPVVRFTKSLSGALDRLAEVPLWSMTPAEERTVLVELCKQRARLEELELALLVQADRDGVGRDSGATSTPAWLAHATKTTTAGRHRELHLARKLDQSFTATKAALAAGGDRCGEGLDRDRGGGGVDRGVRRPPGRGRGPCRFKLPTLHAHVLKKALEALTSPRRIGSGMTMSASCRRMYRLVHA